MYFANLSNKKKIIISGQPQRIEYDDRVMIFSPGSLPNGLSVEDIKNGMTAKRNQILVSALDKADFIENYATGVRRIFKDYEDYDKKPEYNTFDNGVILTLYNRNYIVKNDPKKFNSEDRRMLIVKEMKINSKVTIMELSDKFCVSEKTIKRDIEKLKKENKIYRQGSLTDGSWIVVK